MLEVVIPAPAESGQSPTLILHVANVNEVGFEGTHLLVPGPDEDGRTYFGEATREIWRSYRHAVPAEPVFLRRTAEPADAPEVSPTIELPVAVEDQRCIRVGRCQRDSRRNRPP